MAYAYDILLGKISKVSGFEGAVVVRLEKGFIENIPEMESVFLEIEGRPVPFFITSTEYSGADTLKLQFEDYNSNEKISEFIGCRVFLTNSDKNDTISEDSSDFTGYKVYYEGSVLLGTVSGITENHSQWLMNINSIHNKNILIPLHEDFIVKIDRPGKTIIMDIPEGLIDLN